MISDSLYETFLRLLDDCLKNKDISFSAQKLNTFNFRMLKYLKFANYYLLYTDQDIDIIYVTV